MLGLKCLILLLQSILYIGCYFKTQNNTHMLFILCVVKNNSGIFLRTLFMLPYSMLNLYHISQEETE